ncbi:LytTR family DNA-binding domain-containing protein [Polaribacter marinaquae]|uniref:LytTR family DNA-binding domain-containing protein n=1 Tax=Polaribacter marinaquae TaxID=1642819 RepID=A0ABZ2TSP9_9FLAO
MKKLLYRKYPFDPSIKNHCIVAFGLAIWVFIFLFYTEPFDVNQFKDDEMPLYMSLYGLLVGTCYLVFIPIQEILFKKYKENWYVISEILFLLTYVIISIIAARLFYLYAVVPGEPYPYTLGYHLKAILIPAFLTILPIVIFGRFAFGKYKNKKTEAKKIEIKGEGNYEGLRLLFNDVICIQSSDNYIEVFYLNGSILKKTLIRNKLSVIANEFPELLRTHRSYLINPYHFLQWKTEKSKLFILLFHHIEVPVSKTYQNNVKSILNSTTE